MRQRNRCENSRSQAYTLERLYGHKRGINAPRVAHPEGEGPEGVHLGVWQGLKVQFLCMSFFVGWPWRLLAESRGPSAQGGV